MTSLAKRIVTALALIPLVIWVILGLDPLYFSLMTAIFVIGGSWEWAAIAGWRLPHQKSVYVCVFAMAMPVAYLVVDHSLGLMVLLLLAMIWWMLAAALILIYQRNGEVSTGSSWVRSATGMMVLIPTWVALIALHRHNSDGPYLVVFLLALIWAADSAAFFVGRRWGKTRLASRVSPAKSWEGAVGGVLAAVVLAGLVSGFLGLGREQFPLFLLLALVTAMISILGDLVESLYKRQAGLKDSGNILPGHGGVMDRIDSLTAAAPLFVAGLYCIENL